MTDYAGGTLGGVVFPVTASTTNSALRDCDPSLYFAIDFFAAMLSTHLQARLLAEVAIVGPATLTQAVAMKIAIDPRPWLAQNQFKFPLLAVHRKSGTFTEKTVHYRRRLVDCEVAYILPPLTAAQAQRLIPILNAAADILMHRTEQGADPTYTPPGSTMGASVWTAAALDYIGFTGEAQGAFQDATGELYFPAWTATLRIAERTGLVSSDFESMTSAQTSIDIDQTTIPVTPADIIDIADTT